MPCSLTYRFSKRSQLRWLGGAASETTDRQENNSSRTNGRTDIRQGNEQNDCRIWKYKKTTQYMNLNLTGKTALVCGSTQGIGRASAVELAELGATVVLMARNEDRLRQTLATLDTGTGQTHRYIVANYSQEGAVSQAIQQHLASYPNLHILI